MDIRFKRRGYLCTLVLLSGLISGCLLEKDSGSESGTEVEIVPEEHLDPGALVCDPLEEGQDNLDVNQGVLGHLYYLNPDQPHFSRVSDYIDLGQDVTGLDLYFNQIFIPTRPFDRGFVTLSGQPIQTVNGDTLYEYFALRLSGRVRLGEGDSPGLYQFAVLSDDGSVLSMETVNGNGVVVDNDGHHPTRMGCAAEPIELQAGDAIPFQLDYYQGPRYHIALTLMWREWTGDASDPECGRLGNSRYFDSTQDPPTPQPAYLDLLSRGWKPLKTDNYLLPVDDNGEETENPCNAPAPEIIEVVVASVVSASATVTWFTDIPATSQLSYTNQKTGETLVTDMDINMSTHHSVSLAGLQSNTVYSVRAISQSSSGLSSESSEVLLRTAR